MTAKKKEVIQQHHLIYGSKEHPKQEWIEPMTRAEHYHGHNATRFKAPSRGYLKLLSQYVLRHWPGREV